MHGGKRMVIIALLIGLSITLFGWSQQIYTNEQFEAQQIVAWNNFVANSTGTHPHFPTSIMSLISIFRTRQPAESPMEVTV